MARKVKIELVDDLDGSVFDAEDGETISFGLDGTFLEIDLSSKNAAAMRKALSKYVEVARKTAPPRKPRNTSTISTPSTRRSPEEVKAIKAWLVENNYEPPQRGRIPKEMLDAYEAAHAPSEEAAS